MNDGSRYCVNPSCPESNPQPLLNFGKDKNGPGGLTKYCKTCQKLKRQASKDKTREYNKKYKADHASEISESRKQYYQDHKEEAKQNRRDYYREHHDHELETMAEYRHSKGMEPMTTAKDSSLFLGVHVTEAAIREAYPDIKQMRHGNPKFDLIDIDGSKIDVKSATTYRFKNKDAIRWEFRIRKNDVPDFFICVAFDNRDDLNVIQAWKFPGSVVNHLETLSISPGSFKKWEQYEIDLGEDARDYIRSIHG